VNGDVEKISEMNMAIEGSFKIKDYKIDQFEIRGVINTHSISDRELRQLSSWLTSKGIDVNRVNIDEKGIAETIRIIQKNIHAAINIFLHLQKKDLYCISSIDINIGMFYNFFGIYIPNKKNKYRVSINISIPFFILERQSFIRNNPEQKNNKRLSISMLYELISHELVHHFDHEYILSVHQIFDSISYKVKKELVSIHGLWLYDAFRTLRTESFPKLAEDYTVYGGFALYHSPLFAEFKDFCTGISQLTVSLEEVKLKLQSGTMHDLASHMAHLISVFVLVTEGKSDKLFIYMKKNCLPIKELPRLYGKIDILITYGKYQDSTDFNKDPNILRRAGRLIMSTDSIGFLKLYEFACKKLKLKPLITLKDYKKLQKNCYKNYKKSQKFIV